MPTENTDALTHFTITFEDGSTKTIKAAPWKALDDIEILQTTILESIGESDGHLGTVLKPSNRKFWDAAEKIAKLTPIVGEEEKGFDPRSIEDPDILCKLFITAKPNYSKTTGGLIPEEGGLLVPSVIARMNGLNFRQLLLTAMTRTQEQPQPQKKKPSKTSSTKSKVQETQEPT